MRTLTLLAALIAGAGCPSKQSEPPPAATETPEDAAAAVAIGPESSTAELTTAITTYEGHVLDSLQAAIAACRVLGQRPDPAALDALVAVVLKPVPALDPGLAVRAACTEALGAYDDEKATGTLLAAVAAADEPLAVRRAALVGLADAGDPRAVAPIVDLLVHHAGVGDAARQALAAIGAPAIPTLRALLQGEAPEGVEPGTAAFVAARVLGDLRAEETLAALIASLKRPPQPAMVSRNNEAGPSHHVAVIDALRQIGGPQAAAALREYAAASGEPSLKTLALDAYSQVARGRPDRAHLKTLGTAEANQQVRIASGLAYARMADTMAELKPLVGLAHEHEALRPLIGGLIARAHVGAQCQAELDCLRELLTAEAETLEATLVERYPVLASLSPEQRAELPAAVRERALIDIRHLGADARPLLDPVLEAAGSEYRMVQQTALDALAAIAERPCPRCVTALDAILERPDSRPIAGSMRLAVAATRHYLSR